MTLPVISACSVSKRYVKYEDSPMLVGALIRFRARSRRSRFWALRDLSFDIEAGSTVGIIGRNGSGKTTLLRMLAGITAPTEGVVTVRGRVAPLIAVGVGFHPELTGRENVYVNGVVLGLTKPEIDACFDEIVDFAELHAFIDTPVKFYSSGMFVRLGFATAVVVQPEVLLVDEVLAVGDFAFQQKCYARIDSIREAGATIILVSHNMHAIQAHCPRTLVLHGGECRFDGDTSEAIAVFHGLLDPSQDANAALIADETLVDVSCSVERLEVISEAGRPVRSITSGQQVAFEFDVLWQRDVKNPMIGIMLLNDLGVLVHTDHTHGQETGTFLAGTSTTFRFEAAMRLAAGVYQFHVMIRDADGRAQFMLLAKTVEFVVRGRRSVHGVVDLDGGFRAVE